MKLLHIDSSIQADTSASRVISAAIVDRLKRVHPELEVTYRDLASDPLPHVSLQSLAQEPAQAVLAEFLDSDVLVIGAPMYNFTVASQLKAWIDHIVIAGKTFSYGPDGVSGLAGDKQVYVAHARGGLYVPGSPNAQNEHAEAYLRAVLGFIGVNDPHFITAEGVAYGPELREAALNDALEKAAAIDAVADAA